MSRFPSIAPGGPIKDDENLHLWTAFLCAIGTKLAVHVASLFRESVGKGWARLEIYFKTDSLKFL